MLGHETWRRLCERDDERYFFDLAGSGLRNDDASGGGATK